MMSASLRIDHPEVSEAHAMVSMRGGELHLLSLRGLLRVDGAPVDQLRLEAGRVVTLADGVDLRVSDLFLPGTVLGIAIDDRPAVPLRAPRYSLRADGRLELFPDLLPDACMVIWSTAGGWRCATPASPGDALRVGQHWQLEGAEITVVALSSEEASAAATRSPAPLDRLTIESQYDSLCILRPERAPVHVNGRPAELLTEVGLVGTLVDWDAIAQLLWPRQQRRHLRQQSFHRAVKRLRKLLDQHCIRPDLLRTDNRGNWELFLLPRDTFTANV
jgi:hypothetical protein